MDKYYEDQVEVSSSDPHSHSHNCYHDDITLDGRGVKHDSGSQVKLVSGHSLAFAIVQDIISGGTIYSVGYPSVQAGTTGSLVMNIVMGILMTYTADMLIRWSRGNDPTLHDTLLANQFPKLRLAIEFIGKFSNWAIMYTTMVIQSMMFFRDSLYSFIFEPYNIDKKWASVTAFLLQTLFSFILRTSFLVKLSAVGFIGALVSFFCVIYTGIKETTRESAHCYVESFYKPYGDWNMGISSGIFSTFAYAGVLASNYFAHGFLALTFSVAAKPKRNRRNCWAGFSIALVYYLIASIVQALPFACAKLQPDGNYVPPNAPQDFLLLFKGWVNILNNVGFIISTLLAFPLIYAVTRQCSIDVIPLKILHTPQGYRWGSYIYQIILNAVSFAICLTDTSVQMIGMIGSALGCITWCCWIPIGLDLRMHFINRERKQKYIARWVWYIILGCAVTAMLLLQFVPSS